MRRIFDFFFTIAASIHFNGEATVLLTKVGEYAVLDCKIDFPHDIVIPHILEWRKDVSIILKIITRSLTEIADIKFDCFSFPRDS